MVDQRERQDDVRVGPLEEGPTLTARPAEPRARVREVKDQRQDVVPRLLLDGAVMLLGGSWVDVEGDDAFAGVGSDPAVAPRVRAEIPCPRPGHLANEFVDEADLVGGRRISIARVVGVVGPLGPGWGPVEAFDR